MTDMLTAALEYADCIPYFAVFPVNPADKSPLCAHGFKAASTDEQQIRTWWTRWPNAMIGMPTGGRTELWVLDIDVDVARKIDGRETMVRLEAKHGSLPATLTSATPRGGTQLFFRWFNYLNISTSCSRIGPGIDVRANGGYVVLPPSLRADGVPYRWLTADDHPIMTAPFWLVELGRKQTRPIIDLNEASAILCKSPSARSARDYAWAKTALNRECENVAAAAAGTRNHALNLAAFNLFQIVAAGLLNEQDVREWLFAAANACGLVADDGARQVSETIKSGARAGMKQPRQRPR
jgi:putative DNA primase/helicase